MDTVASSTSISYIPMMSDRDELEQLRARKRQQLLEETEADDSEHDTTAPIQISGPSDLQDTVGQADLVLVDFYADWCGPCRMMEPAIEAVAADTDATVAKVDVDANQELAAKYQVRGVPTLILFHNGEVVERLTGAQDRSTLERVIATHAG